MKKVKATEAKNKFGAVMDAALAEPVTIEKSGRSSVVMISCDEYERLLAFEDAYWASRALAAEAGGVVSDAKVQKLINDTKRA